MTRPAWLDLPAGRAVIEALQQGALSAAATGIEALLGRFPDDPALIYNFAVIAGDLGRLDDAADAYRRLGLLSPALAPRAVAGLLRNAQRTGRFATAEAAIGDLVALLDARLEAIDDLAILKFLAYRRVFVPALDRFAERLERRIAALLGDRLPRTAPRARRRPSRLTIGYLSSCFGDHPIGHVTCRLFAAHDREHFRIIAFSGRDRLAETAPYAAAIRRDVEACREIGALSAAAAAEEIRAAGVDILVALDQHMAWPGAASSPEILVLRPAPLQLAWLGVAAGIGLPSVDFLLADAVTVPPGDEALSAEPVWRLPGCYHCASPHDIATALPTRAACGLPECCVVFAAFNNIEKIDRAAFDAWMAILRAVPESVLWLTNQRGFAITEANLREEAEARGVDGARLIFAGRLPDKEAHLARHAHADLLLDTFTLNASTTALDALWAGLPVLTRRGARFPARLAESFLRGLGMAELVAQDTPAFVALAVAIAQDRDRLAALKARLRRAVATGALFDIAAFAAKLEAAYDAIWAGGTSEDSVA
jgi:predicted O-linked N-acetylglucosamine transferase (SPINDLY family)